MMGVSLYTSRVILSALGVNDYGIYNVVGGIVALFAVISGSLSSAIARFITFELGTGNKEKLKKIFSTSLAIQLMISLLIILICCSIGFWFLNAKMNISPERIGAANWVLFFSMISFVVSLISVPYNAVIIAHEKMSAFAYVSIVEVSLKLAVAFLITAFSHNRLIIYAAMILGVTIIIRMIYGWYCNRHFEECKVRPRYEKSLFKEMSRFAGWNFIGSASSILRNQGNNIILNLFFGTIVNAAYAICMQVNNAVIQLSDNFMISVNPQITKYYAQKDYQEMNKLIIRSSRLSYYLTWLIGSLILFNTSYILTLWLKEVPAHTVVFVQLIIVFSLSESVSRPLIVAMLATGNIRNYQLVVGGLQMMNLPVSYVILKLGGGPYWPLVIAVIISILCFGARMVMLRKMMPFSTKIFIAKSYFNVLSVTAISCLLPFFVIWTIGEASDIWKMAWQSFAYLLWSAIVIFLVGCNKHERIFIVEKLNTIKKKF